MKITSRHLCYTRTKIIHSVLTHPLTFKEHDFDNNYKINSNKSSLSAYTIEYYINPHQKIFKTIVLLCKLCPNV